MLGAVGLGIRDLAAPGGQGRRNDDVGIGSEDSLVGEGGHRQYLLDRPRLVGILDGPIAGLALLGLPRLVRVEGGHRHHGEYLAIRHVHHDDLATLGLGVLDGRAQCLLGHEL